MAGSDWLLNWSDKKVYRNAFSYGVCWRREAVTPIGKYEIRFFDFKGKRGELLLQFRGKIIAKNLHDEVAARGLADSHFLDLLDQLTRFVDGKI